MAVRVRHDTLAFFFFFFFFLILDLFCLDEASFHFVE
jgi:hypothetical protein